MDSGQPPIEIYPLQTRPWPGEVKFTETEAEFTNRHRPHLRGILSKTANAYAMRHVCLLMGKGRAMDILKNIRPRGRSSEEKAESSTKSENMCTIRSPPEEPNEGGGPMSCISPSNNLMLRLVTKVKGFPNFPCPYP